MKIFFPSAAEVLTDFEPNGEGLIAWNLLSGLASRGHEIVACVGQSRLSTPAPFDVVEVGATTRFEVVQPLTYAAAAERELRRRGRRAFDVAHWLFPSGALGLRAGSMCGVPLVVGPLPQNWPSPKRRWPPGFLVRRAMGPWLERRRRSMLSAAETILVANRGALVSWPQVPAERTKVLPFPIRLEDFPMFANVATPVVLFIGRLEREKRVDDLLAAFAMVLERVPDAHLVIAGDGTQRHELEQMTRILTIERAVTFVGVVQRSQVATRIAECAVTCLPSNGEPFGMVLLEAMACGRPVVATRSGGPASIVSDPDGGRLVSVGNPSALAEALVEFLVNPSRAKRAGIFNRDRVERLYALDRVLDQLVDVYVDAAA